MGAVAAKNQRKKGPPSATYVPGSPQIKSPGKWKPPPALPTASFRAIGLGTSPSDFAGLDTEKNPQFRMYDREVTFELEVPQKNDGEKVVDGFYLCPHKDELERMLESNQFCFVCSNPFDSQSLKLADKILTKITNLSAEVPLMLVGNVKGRNIGAPNFGKEVGEGLGIRYIEVDESSNHFSKFGDALYLLAGTHLADDGLGGLTVKRARH